VITLKIPAFLLPNRDAHGHCDLFRDVASSERDMIGLEVVTMGRRASEAAREWFADNRYQDYLYLRLENRSDTLVAQLLER
jgi:5-methyltetrahydrofolate--homocysteine methyltransferase